MPAVKIGVSRQVVIPKRIHEALGLTPGDYLEVSVEKGKVVLTPKTLVDKKVEQRLAEGLDDIRKGRVHGPFSSGKELVSSLRGGKKRQRKAS